MKRKYQHKRTHWRGWPKFLGWLFLLVSTALCVIAFAETNDRAQPLPEFNVRLIVESLLAVVGFLVKRILDRTASTQSKLFELIRADREKMCDIERSLESHITRCNTIMGMEDKVRKSIASDWGKIKQ